MASWATKRKYTYLFVTVVFLGLVVGLPVFLSFYKAPSCFDGKQNGKERGIDCGGACTQLCPADYAAPRVLWSYSVKVVPGVYNALAYIQNPNQNVEVEAIGYLFKLYDNQGILVSQREGYTFIPAGQKFAVFEGGIQTGTRVPAKTTFEFTSSPLWRLGNMFTKLRVLDINLTEGKNPRAEVKVKNDSIDQSFSNVTTFIILYDQDDNRVAFSKTNIESIAAGDTTTVYFTWPEGFSVKIVRSEVLFVAKP